MKCSMGNTVNNTGLSVLSGRHRKNENYPRKVNVSRSHAQNLPKGRFGLGRPGWGPASASHQVLGDAASAGSQDHPVRRAALKDPQNPGARGASKGRSLRDPYRSSGVLGASSGSEQSALQTPQRSALSWAATGPKS